jgi:GTP-binding protein
MQISSAIFELSAPDLQSCPDESLPEFAFIGRSNSGKSSLLNLLAGREGLARTSPKPGFTKLINFFTVNKTWRLVDLPGYGFAEGAKKDSARFNKAVARYLKHRPNLCCVFALIDSSLKPQALDVDFVEWLTRNGVPFVLVFTKTDKNSQTAGQTNIRVFLERIAPWFVQPPRHFTCSATLGQGRRELLVMIEETLAAIEIPSPPSDAVPDDAPTSLTVARRPLTGRENRKTRPDLARPW